MADASIYEFIASSAETKLSDDRMSFVIDIASSDFAPPTQAVAINVASGAVFDLNTSASGEKGNGTIGETHTVNGGKFVAFVSTSSNLVAGDTNGVADVFLRNIETGEVTLVSKSAAGVQGNGVSGGLDVSADGTRLLFHSDASNLVAGDANGFRDVFVRDIASGKVTLVSASASGRAGNGGSEYGAFSPDGRSVAFRSAAADLVSNDINGAVDVFLKNLDTGAVTPLSYLSGADGIESIPVTGRPVFSANGDSVAFGQYSYALNADGLILLDVTRHVATYELDRVTVSQGDGSAPRSYEFAYVAGTGIGSMLKLGLDYDRDGDFQATLTGLKSGTVVTTLTYDVKVRSHAGSQNFTGTGGGEVVVLSSRDDRADGGAGDDVLLGAAGRDDLSGGAGNDILDGGRGADTLRGGAGDDRYLIDDRGDGVIEAAGAGRDTVVVAFSTTLAAHIEDLELTGTENLSGTGNDLGNTITGNGGNNTLIGLGGADDLRGGAGDDRLEGGSGDDILDGGAGTDRLIGGSGNDSYAIDSAKDLIEEAAGGGIDTVFARFSHILGANMENLSLLEDTNIYAGKSYSGSGNSVGNVITGNSKDNVLNGLGGNDTLIGGGGRDTLIGGAGNDRMVGGTGNDTYFVTEARDRVVEAVGEGFDTINTSIDWTLSDVSEVERLAVASNTKIGLKLVGNALANQIVGGGRDDVLDGGTGADTLTGGAGSDTYTIDNAGDVIVESSSAAGSDTLIASVNYTLTENAAVETLRFAEGRTASLDLIGNGFGQTLIGNGGASRLIGGGGDDTYIVDDGNDLVFESADGGNDTVITSSSYRLGDGWQIETLKLASPTSAASRNLQGNGVANTLIGNAGSNTLNGDGGADKLYGLAGNDIYIIDDVGDQVFEKAGEGYDSIHTFVSYVLAAGQSVESLRLEFGGRTSHDLTGNELDNSLFGNYGNNRLDGGGGNDSLSGGGGRDVLIGGAGDDTLESSGHGDVLIGGSGNDTATIIGGSNAKVGLSFVMKSVNGTTTLVGNGTTTTGIGNIRLEGGSGNDTFTTLNGSDNLKGGAGNDVLDGGAGADRLTGGAGNDTLIVDNAGDQVFEAAGDGTDKVLATVSYALHGWQEIEALQLASSTGKAAFSLTGNEFGQTLVGNKGANALNGGLGNDVLIGGKGADTFVFATALGASNIDRIADFAVEDTMRLSKSVFEALAPGQLKANEFKDIGKGGKVDADDHILYDSRNGNLFYDADGSGKAGPVKFAVLDNKAAITHADFLIV